MISQVSVIRFLILFLCLQGNSFGLERDGFSSVEKVSDGLRNICASVRYQILA